MEVNSGMKMLTAELATELPLCAWKRCAPQEINLKLAHWSFYPNSHKKPRTNSRKPLMKLIKLQLSC